MSLWYYSIRRAFLETPWIVSIVCILGYVIIYICDPGLAADVVDTWNQMMAVFGEEGWFVGIAAMVAMAFFMLVFTLYSFITFVYRCFDNHSKEMQNSKLSLTAQIYWAVKAWQKLADEEKESGLEKLNLDRLATFAHLRGGVSLRQLNKILENLGFKDIKFKVVHEAYTTSVQVVKK